MIRGAVGLAGQPDHLGSDLYGIPDASRRPAATESLQAGA
jgi:hypothetical protein